MHLWSLTARWIFPVDAPPMPNAVVVIADDKIAAIEPTGTRTADADLGNAAIIPGLVNAHAHLDLTGMSGKCPPTPDFTHWLLCVGIHRQKQSPRQLQDDINAGITECHTAGTTLVGDIAASGASWEALANAPLRAVVFYELLGLPPARARQAWRNMVLWKADRTDTATCRWALSPHAPYSVHKSLISVAALYSRPVAIHIAETREELQLLANQQGPFTGFLTNLGVWYPRGLVSDIAQVLYRCRIAPKILYAHANYLPVDARIPRNASTIYCPRTHAAFGHAPHPFREFLQRGVRVALGTDSLASNPDLSILAEMRFIHHRYADFPGDALLRMGTLSGAEALGWADEAGSLTPGKSADLAVVPLPSEDGDPYHLLLASSQPVTRTMFRGQWVHP
jgi:aminodeoxyfutalosine deaminase